MKKLVLLFLIAIFAQSVYAAIDSRYTTDERYFKNTGYSAEMANIVEVQKADPYREPEESVLNQKGHFWQKFYHFLIPAQSNNIDFYNHSIELNRGSSWKDY